jgi:predicted membrane protein
MKTFFSPLDKKYCIYFLLLTMIFFTVLVFVIIAELIFVFKYFKQLNFRTVSSGLLMLSNAFLAYFSNRLLYTMCTEQYA